MCECSFATKITFFPAVIKIIAPPHLICKTYCDKVCFSSWPQAGGKKKRQDLLIIMTMK